MTEYRYQVKIKEKNAIANVYLLAHGAIHMLSISVSNTIY
jgi:hypothetical protein